jgi:molecular chaperone GrpE (heat shock protein)
MLNFEAELDKLLSHETDTLPHYEFAELAEAAQFFLAELNKKQTDVSLQIEEIYDLVKEQDTRVWQEAVNVEKTRANHLVFAAISLSDLLEDFYTYARQSGSEELKHQARLLWENAAGILSKRGVFRFGEEGQPLNPQIHTVKASAESPLPRERVLQVLQSGYLYQNALLRKAAVVISRGQEDAVLGMETADAAVDDADDAGNEDSMDDTGNEAGICGNGMGDTDDAGDEDDADDTGDVSDENDADYTGNEDGMDDTGDAGDEDDADDTGDVGDEDDAGNTGVVDDTNDTGNEDKIENGFNINSTDVWRTNE